MSTGRLCDDDPFLEAGPCGPMNQSGPQVGGDRLAGQVRAVEAHVEVCAVLPRLVFDAIARALYTIVIMYIIKT
jgi:hypothetical protein